jgi:hypothetical protein
MTTIKCATCAATLEETADTCPECGGDPRVAGWTLAAPEELFPARPPMPAGRPDPGKTAGFSRAVLKAHGWAYGAVGVFTLASVVYVGGWHPSLLEVPVLYGMVPGALWAAKAWGLSTAAQSRLMAVLMLGDASLAVYHLLIGDVLFGPVLVVLAVLACLATRNLRRLRADGAWEGRKRAGAWTPDLPVEPPLVVSRPPDHG